MSQEPPAPIASNTSDELTEHNETQKQYHTELSEGNTISNVSHQSDGTNRSSTGDAYSDTNRTQENKVHIAKWNVERAENNATLLKVSNKTMDDEGCMMPNGSFTNNTYFCQKQKLSNSMKGKGPNSLHDKNETKEGQGVWNVVTESPDASVSLNTPDSPS